MKQRPNLTILILINTIIVICLMTGVQTLHAAEPGINKKILLLNSYHAGYKGSDDIVLGFKDTLRSSFPDANVIIEYLDSKHFSGPEFDTRVLDTLAFKYRKNQFDLIVSTDDYAFNILERHRDQLFGQVPVVFCGTNNFDKERIKGRPDFVGIDENPSFDETLELMFRLHPETGKIVTIHDNSVTGQLNSADFRKDASRFVSRATFSYLSGKRLEELVHEVGQLKPGTLLVYFASFVQDTKGKRHSSIEALQLISHASSVPVYGGWEFNLGHGIVGGRLINLREHGKAAAVLAIKILQGESLENLTGLQPSPNKFMFDYAELKRFAIPESSLPTGSEIINLPPSFFSRYGTALLAVLSGSLFLLVVISFARLYVSNRNLKQSKIKFSSMVEAFDGLIYVCSADHRIEFMNERMIERTGYDATGELCHKALHGLDSVCSWCRNDRVFAGENSRWEVLSPKDDRWYNVSNTLIRNADGSISKQAMITDITEHKKANRFAEQYQSIIMASFDGFWITDTKGKILVANDSICRILGYSREELLGLSIAEIEADETPEEVAEQTRKMIETGYVRFEARHRRKDGTIINVEVGVQHIADIDDLLFAFVRDVTERKRQEEQIRKSEYELRMLAEAMPQIVWITRPDGWNIYFNQQWVDYTGLSLEESYGHGWSKPFHPDDRQIAWDAWQNAINRRGTYGLECRLRRADGTYLWWLIRGTPLLDEQGEIIKWYGTCTDIDELRTSKEQLNRAKAVAESANRAKSEFLANMSHEIRTPMNGLLGMTQLLELTQLTKEQQDYVAILKSSGENLLSLINDILDLSKIEAGKITVEHREFNLLQSIRDVAVMQKKVANDKGLAFDVDLDGNIPPVIVGDQLRVKQILLNLLGNAIKFTATGGITISGQLREQNDTSVCVQITVRDTGIGISAKALENVFQPFVQEDGSTTRKYGGSGLGLSISRNLAELLGGDITIESAPGKGSSFTVVLPFSIGTGSVITQELSKPVNNNWNGPPLRILLVEDDDINTKFGASLLKKLGLDVVTVENGRKCLAVLEREVFDLVLMDIQMPDMGGDEAIKEIRAKERETPLHQPVIALTAHTLQGDIERFLGAGFDGYLSKPLETGELMGEIRRVMGLVG